MNYQRQRHDPGKIINVSSVDRIGEPYRPTQQGKSPVDEVYYEKEGDDSLGSIKLYDLSANNNIQQPTTKISIRNDVGAPIPLEYRKQRRNLSTVRYTEQEENTKARLAPESDHRQRLNTAKKMDTFLKQEKPAEKQRHLKITILATDDQDVVRVCKSLINEYSSKKEKALYTLGTNLVLILLVTLLTYLILSQNM